MTVGGEELRPDPPTPDRDQAILDRVWRWGSELANAREELTPLARRLAALRAKLADSAIGTPEQRETAEAKAREMAERLGHGLRGCRETITKLVGQRSLLSDEGRARLADEWRMPEIRDGDDEALAARVWAWLGFATEQEEA